MVLGLDEAVVSCVQQEFEVPHPLDSNNTIMITKVQYNKWAVVHLASIDAQMQAYILCSWDLTMAIVTLDRNGVGEVSEGTPNCLGKLLRKRFIQKEVTVGSGISKGLSRDSYSMHTKTT